MDYNTLLDMTVELGYQLAMCGAETFRIEDSICRIMDAYGIAAEAFAIPNCLHVSIETAEGKPMTRMRRIGYHGNDLDGVEKYNELSRRICREYPDPKIAMEWIHETDNSRKRYSMASYLIGNFLGAAGFAILFSGSFKDSLCAGICGLIIGLANRFMDNQKVNQFFRTIVSAFLMAISAYMLSVAGVVDNTDAVIIGALMILVPGLLFTNAMRDIIYGDTNSGINRIVQVLLIAAAIALGTGAAWRIINYMFGVPSFIAPSIHSLYFQCLASFVGCIGFFILFNIHGYGGLLCALGGMLTWLIFSLFLHFGFSDLTCYFCGTVFASVYSEIMARVRKCPAISYLVISAFPLIPGAGVYYTMNHAVRGNMSNFASQGMHTAAIAGIMAVGILLASTIVRLCYVWLQRKAKT